MLIAVTMSNNAVMMTINLFLPFIIPRPFQIPVKKEKIYIRILYHRFHATSTIAEIF